MVLNVEHAASLVYVRFSRKHYINKPAACSTFKIHLPSPTDEQGGNEMRGLLGLFLICVVLIASTVFSSTVYGKMLWYDDFEDGEINQDYVFKNHPGTWIEEKGVIKQTNPAPQDHAYLIIEGGFAEPHSVIVKIRIDDWGDDDLSRAGIGVRLDPGDGAGYAFLIHHTLNNMEFLNDHLAWKANDTPPPFGAVEKGKWYWMKAEISDDGFFGKIWPENEKEPDWLLESKFDFGAVRAVSGNVGLNGGSNQGSGKTNVSFDDFAIFDNSDEATPAGLAKAKAVDVNGKLSIKWGQIKRI